MSGSIVVPSAAPSLASNRVSRELKEIAKCPELAQCNVKLDMVNDNLMNLHGVIGGPSDTPYEGGIFHIEVKIPDTYPFQPPKMRFITRIWHPNISSVTGAICLDILKDQWAAGMTLRTVLLSLQALLCKPEPDDPQDSVVAKQCKDAYKLFQLTARHWTASYAGATDKVPELTTKVTQLAQMGFDLDVARVALSSNNWDAARATDQILAGQYAHYTPP